MAVLRVFAPAALAFSLMGQVWPGGGPLPRTGPQIPNPIPRRAPRDGKTQQAPVLEYRGMVKSIGAETLDVVLADTRILTLRLSRETKYWKNGAPAERSELKPGAEVRVEARRREEGALEALKVELLKAPPASPQEPPAPTVTPLPPPDEDDAPPKLQRGRPAPRPSSGAPVEEPAAVAPPPPESPDEFLEQARTTALSFSESLPNYLCRQTTARYESQTRKPNWVPLDVVTADLVYEDGKESYRNIRINDKPLKKGAEEPPGTWSTGEFASTLLDLFSPATAAQFRRVKDSTAAGRPAVIYDFRVEQPNSHWRVSVGPETAYPAYKGSLWIDKETRRVLRIEMQSIRLPDEFPVDKIEWAVDYDFVRIGGQPYLLPVHAENLACFRGGWTCTRNALDFRNYRKFTSESQLLVTDSTITYDEGGEPKAPTKPK